ncbi:unnamed protein product [Lampetra planeri]
MTEEDAAAAADDDDCVNHTDESKYCPYNEAFCLATVSRDLAERLRCATNRSKLHLELRGLDLDGDCACRSVGGAGQSGPQQARSRRSRQSTVPEATFRPGGSCCLASRTASTSPVVIHVVIHVVITGTPRPRWNFGRANRPLVYAAAVEKNTQHISTNPGKVRAVHRAREECGRGHAIPRELSEVLYPLAGVRKVKTFYEDIKGAATQEIARAPSAVARF